MITAKVGEESEWGVLEWNGRTGWRTWTTDGRQEAEGNRAPVQRRGKGGGDSHA